MSCPEILQRVDLCWLQLHLELQEACQLPQGFALQLRRELLRVGRELLPPALWRQLLDPPLPLDPEGVRRFQRPAPGFVLKSGAASQVNFAEGEELRLQVLFCGEALTLLEPFLTLVRTLGSSGLHQGQGRFELIRIGARESSGHFTPLWQRGQRFAALAPSLLTAAWLAEQTCAAQCCRIEFVTPARLMSQGKPLFRPTFTEIFPFMLRRVGAMLYHWGRIESFGEQSQLLAAARALTTTDNSLGWQDWRKLDTGRGETALGGVCGSITVAGSSLEEVGWILSLAALFHVGRSAAYGSGELRIISFFPE